MQQAVVTRAAAQQDTVADVAQQPLIDLPLGEVLPGLYGFADDPRQQFRTFRAVGRVPLDPAEAQEAVYAGRRLTFGLLGQKFPAYRVGDSQFVASRPAHQSGFQLPAERLIARVRRWSFTPGRTFPNEPPAQSALEGGFQGAGFPSVPTTSPGMQYTLPDGSLVRIMESAGRVR